MRFVNIHFQETTLQGSTIPMPWPKWPDGCFEGVRPVWATSFHFNSTIELFSIVLDSFHQLSLSMQQLNIICDSQIHGLAKLSPAANTPMHCSEYSYACHRIASSPLSMVQLNTCTPHLFVIIQIQQISVFKYKCKYMYLNSTLRASQSNARTS